MLSNTYMDHLHYSLRNTYTAQPLDRVAHKRKDPKWLEAQLADPRSQYLVLHGHKIVTVERSPLILSRDELQNLKVCIHPYLLGVKLTDQTPVFLINIPNSEESLIHLFATDTSLKSNKKATIESLSLREITPDVDVNTASMYSYATLLNHWHITTRFCTRCGSALEIKEGGSIQQCTNVSCEQIEYPRINPAVIMRVTKGNRILLARQACWPEIMYSVLAGFVEVGETLEQAVKREVMEEVNIRVENINYHSSQPWPFPNSMMLGYTAEACSSELDLDQDEIEHAMWLTADEMKLKIADGSLFPSSEISISRRLIDDWFVDQAGMTIREFIATLNT